MRLFRGFGLVFDSDLPLTGFAPLDAEAGVPEPELNDGPDVIIRIGDEAQAVCEREFGETNHPEGIRTASNGGYVIRILETCDYWVANQNEIHLTPAPNAPQGHILLFLAGSVIGMILHLRGIHTLHAATVARGGAAIAFVGNQGAGKSTLATAMAHPAPRAAKSAPCRETEMQILGDDVIALEATETEIRAHPGAATFKLWQDTLDHFGMTGEETIANRADKFFVASPRPAGEPAPLGAVALIQRDPERDWDRDGGILAERLPPVEALGLIMLHGYRPEYVQALGRLESHFRQSAAVAARLPVWRLTRPEGLEHLAATRDWLETHWDELIAPLPVRTDQGRAARE